MVAPLGGVGNVRNGPLLACVKPRLGQLTLHQRRSWTFGTPHTVFLRMATHSTISILPLFSTTTMMLAWSGHTIQLLNQLAISSSMRILSVNGYRTILSIWLTLLEKLTQPIYLQKRWVLCSLPLSKGLFHDSSIRSHEWFSPRTSPSCQRSHTVTLAAGLVGLGSGWSSYMAALASNSFCCTLSNVSHLCSLGRHLFWKHYGLVPSGLT